MKWAGPRSWLVMGILAAGVWAGTARADSFWVGTHAHGLLAELKEDWGAAGDVGVFAAWRPIPALAFGLDATCLFPLRTAGDERTTDVALRVGPALWLLSGEEEAWWYLKIGTGVDNLNDGSRWRTEWTLLLAAGVAVAPRELVFHFGFELLGEWAPLADSPVRTIGLGGFVGWQL